MRQGRFAAAVAVKHDIDMLETRGSEMIEENAKFIVSMLRHRREAGLPMTFGLDAIGKAAAAASAFTVGMQHLEQCHRSLAEARIDAGLRAVAIGDETGCPTHGAVAELSVPLRAVG